jgi:hypothetical protein
MVLCITTEQEGEKEALELEEAIDNSVTVSSRSSLGDGRRSEESEVIHKLALSNQDLGRTTPVLHRQSFDSSKEVIDLNSL